MQTVKKLQKCVGHPVVVRIELLLRRYLSDHDKPSPTVSTNHCVILEVSKSRNHFPIIMADVNPAAHQGNYNYYIYKLENSLHNYVQPSSTPRQLQLLKLENSLWNKSAPYCTCTHYTWKVTKRISKYVGEFGSNECVVLTHERCYYKLRLTQG